MSKQNLTRFLQSFILIPILIVTPLSGIIMKNETVVVINEETIEDSVITTQEEINRKEKADAIDIYFAKYNAPLEGYGMKFVIEAEKNNIDWRLLPAIAMRESTGGKYACKKVSNSVFGYGSCKISFSSIDESIEVVTHSLGGNNPQTSHYYKNKTTLQILKKYNSVINGYSNQIVKIMKTIKNDGKEII